MGVAVVFLIGLLVCLVGAAATARWLWRFWRRERELPRSTKIIALIVAVAAMCGAFGAAIGLIKGFGAVGGESVDPSQKARILAEGISEAMNCIALGLVLGVPSVLALFLITRRRSDRSE